MRQLNQEHADNDLRSYAYDFDWVIRSYLLKNWASYISPSGPSLELGAYQGDMTEQILKYCPNLTVVEGATDLAEKILERFGQSVNVHASYFEDFYSPNKFDNVFLVHTLEHLDNPVEILKKINDEWLSEKGKLFVAVPNANALSRQIAVQMGIVEFNSAITPGELAHGHRKTYSIDTLQSEMIKAGYKSFEVGGVLLKTLSNSQFDKAIESGIVSKEYLDGIDGLAKIFPDLSASIFIVASKF